MSIQRWATKTDSVQSDIVEALEKCGVHVWIIKQPCDLLCWHSRFGAGNFKVLEVKTAYGKRTPKPRIDRRQKAQHDFLALTGAMVVTDLTGALSALGLIQPPPTSVSCMSPPPGGSTSSVAAP